MEFRHAKKSPNVNYIRKDPQPPSSFPHFTPMRLWSCVKNHSRLEWPVDLKHCMEPRLWEGMQWSLWLVELIESTNGLWERNTSWCWVWLTKHSLLLGGGWWSLYRKENRSQKICILFFILLSQCWVYCTIIYIHNSHPFKAWNSVSLIRECSCETNTMNKANSISPKIPFPFTRKLRDNLEDGRNYFQLISQQPKNQQLSQ